MTTVRTKGYTLNYFINTFSNLTPRQVGNTLGQVYNAVSPTLGGSSVRSYALDNWFGTPATLEAVVTGQGTFANYGKTARARVLKALRNRKRFGTV